MLVKTVFKRVHVEKNAMTVRDQTERHDLCTRLMWLEFRVASGLVTIQRKIYAGTYVGIPEFQNWNLIFLMTLWIASAREKAEQKFIWR